MLNSQFVIKIMNFPFIKYQNSYTFGKEVLSYVIAYITNNIYEITLPLNALSFRLRILWLMKFSYEKS